MPEIYFLILSSTIIVHQSLCSLSDVNKLEQKESFVDYLPEHLGTRYKSGVVFKQQKYDELGNLKQVSSIAFRKKEHTPKYPDNLVDVNKVIYYEFSEFLKGTNIDVRFIQYKRHVLPILVSKKYLYEDENLGDIETLSYDGAVTIDSNIYPQIMNLVNGNNVYMQSLGYRGNDLSRNITMKFDTSNAKQILPFLLRNISLTQLVNIMSVLQQALTAYEDELLVAGFVSDTLDLLYPNYDWAVVVDVIGSSHDFHRKEEIKYVVILHKETMYTIYTLPPI